MILKKIASKFIEKFYLYDIYYYFWNNTGKYSNRKQGIKRVYVLTEPEYGNLGDQAIALSTEYFFKDKFQDYEIVGVSISDTYKYLREIIESSTKNDLFVIQGGGNMGNLYPDIEYSRRFCIRHVKHHILISMPTTITFISNKKGLRDLKKSIKVYKKNNNLILTTREKFSYEFAQKNYKNEVFLIPDIVFYLRKYLNNKINSRRDYIIALRKELESDIKGNDANNLLDEFCNRYPDAFIYDTTVSRSVNALSREHEVMSLIHEFQRAKVVLTDRMHGMILCSITNTPCVVLKSLDNKIIGSYEWIKDLGYISLFEKFDINKLLDACDELSLSSAVNDFIDLDKYFDKLERIIRETNEKKQ